MKHIDTRLKEVLLMKGINASTMAKELNISKGHISNIMTGRIKNPKKHLHSIAEYLKISSAWLLTGEGNPDAGIDGRTSLLPVYTLTASIKQYLGKYKLSGMIFSDAHFGLRNIPSFPEDMLAILHPSRQGSGFYLLQESERILLAQRIDHLSRLEWCYFSASQPKTPLILGKIEALIHQEIINYEET
jgi:transcriptional regulator with XRE-family HTH domain